MGSRLYYGDNLEVLRADVRDESVDLVYLDPPFNSNTHYNLVLKSGKSKGAEASIRAFDDTWAWCEASQKALLDIDSGTNRPLQLMMRVMHEALSETPLMAYLVMMAVRLVELHRVLRPAGSLYLHCDPTASHYLKMVLDAVFGTDNYRSEIIWKRTFAHGNVSRGYGDVTDTIYFYSKTKGFTWNQLYTRMSAEKADKVYVYSDPDGRRWQSVTLRNPSMRPNLHYPYTLRNGVTYQPHPNGWSCNIERMTRYDQENRLHFPMKESGSLRLKMYEDESRGSCLQSLWDDIPPLSANAQERFGYPTQKPLALLERIIAASSNEGDVVLDPFCGCGTAVHAAQKLGRQWIGIDVTHLAIGLIEKRMTEAFSGLRLDVIGRPQSLADAEELARRDMHQFELWALSMVNADPWKGGRKGPDGGIDGIIWFKPDGKKTEKAIVEVKGGATGVKDVGRLAQVMELENARIGVLITAQSPTRAMERDAAAVGVWENAYTGRKHARLQIITLAELFQNRRPDIPWVDSTVGKKAKREATEKQGSLL